MELRPHAAALRTRRHQGEDTPAVRWWSKGDAGAQARCGQPRSTHKWSSTATSIGRRPLMVAVEEEEEGTVVVRRIAMEPRDTGQRETAAELRQRQWLPEQEPWHGSGLAAPEVAHGVPLCVMRCHHGDSQRGWEGSTGSEVETHEGTRYQAGLAWCGGGLHTRGHEDRRRTVGRRFVAQVRMCVGERAMGDGAGFTCAHKEEEEGTGAQQHGQQGGDGAGTME